MLPDVGGRVPGVENIDKYAIIHLPKGMEI